MTCTTDLTSNWFAIHTKVRRERVANSALQNRGFETFLPLCKTRRRWSDRIKELEVPLFPRYFFCRFKLHDHRQVVTTLGIEYVVGIAKNPVAIPDAEIASLEAVMRSDMAAQQWPFIQKGQWIRITSGALAGIEGILQDCRGNRRLVISVTLLQRSVALDIDRLDVTPIAPPSRPLSTVVHPHA